MPQHVRSVHGVFHVRRRCARSSLPRAIASGRERVDAPERALVQPAVGVHRASRAGRVFTDVHALAVRLEDGGQALDAHAARSNARVARCRRPASRQPGRAFERATRERYFASDCLRVRAVGRHESVSRRAKYTHGRKRDSAGGGAARLATTRDGRARARTRRGSLDTRIPRRR